MRPMDIFSEKNTRDASPDKIASSTALLNEAQALAGHNKDYKSSPKSTKESDSDFNSAVGMGQRDKLALASIAFCSPLMLLEMGAILGIADGMRMDREHGLRDNPNRNLRESKFEKIDNPIRKALLSMPTDALVTRMEPKKSKSKLD